MPVRRISPYVNVFEKDLSGFVIPPAKTSLLLVGEANKGPIGVPTVVSSTDDFRTKFGSVLDNAFLAQAALNFLNHSSDLLVVRTAYDQDIIYRGTVTKQKFTLNSTTNGKKLKISINGGLAGTEIVLTAGTDLTADAVAADLNSKFTTASISSYVEAIVTDTKYIDLQFSDTVRKANLMEIASSVYNYMGWADTIGVEDYEIERAWYAQQTVIYTQAPVLESDSLTSADFSDLAGASTLVFQENDKDFFTYTIDAVTSGITGAQVASRLASQLEGQRYTDDTHYKFSAVADKLYIVGASRDTASLTFSAVGNSELATLLGNDFVTYDDATASSVVINVATVKAKTKGTDGNNIKIEPGVNNFGENVIYVYYGTSSTTPVEEISGWNFTEGSTSYIDTLVNANSNYIQIEWSLTEQDVDKMDMIEYQLENGQNGINSSQTTQRMTAFNTDVKNKELWYFNLVAVPGEYSTTGISTIINFCENTRGDCFAMVDSPAGLDSDQIVDWSNGVGNLGNTVKFNSSFGALYWPWFSGSNPDTGTVLPYPTSVYMPAIYAKSDNDFDPWYPPAGAQRGRIAGVFLDTEMSPEIDKRDIMYGKPGNNVNPIVTFKAQGTLVWGQKTLLRSSSALDRVNVRRMVLYAEKGIVDIAQPLLFELNTPSIWQSFTEKANKFLADIQVRGGLTDFLVVCDATTNTPDVIDQNRLVGKIFLKPVKSIEVIDLYFNITSAGGSFT